MTSTKEGKSDESSSGEDEESLRELVSFQHAREILYKFIFLVVVSVVRRSVGSCCNA